jgi:3-hydroxybutyryl-CoA dehydrogenase
MEVTAMKVETVGVAGAGVMGTGVSQNLAQTGHRVILIDISPEILKKAVQEIRKNIRFLGFFDKSEKIDDPEGILEKITFSTDYELFKEVDFVIENVTEKWEIKRDVFTLIDGICPDHCVFASNTSAIPITRIASLTGRAPKVIGMHFMNPVPLKETVEVIRGYHTSNDTIDAARNLLKGMGKKCVIVNDSPGFVSNRVLMVTINEAIFLLQDGVAPAEDVDLIFKACFGHKMGPLETADLIGLDTILYSLEVLYESFNDSKYRPCIVLKKMVDAGLYGRKSGQGFYSYGAHQPGQ